MTRFGCGCPSPYEDDATSPAAPLRMDLTQIKMIDRHVSLDLTQMSVTDRRVGLPSPNGEGILLSFFLWMGLVSFQVKVLSLEDFTEYRIIWLIKFRFSFVSFNKKFT